MTNLFLFPLCSEAAFWNRTRAWPTLASRNPRQARAAASCAAAAPSQPRHRLLLLSVLEAPGVCTGACAHGPTPVTSDVRQPQNPVEKAPRGCNHEAGQTGKPHRTDQVPVLVAAPQGLARRHAWHMALSPCLPVILSLMCLGKFLGQLVSSAG